jgi:hypothetical protein
MVMVSCFWGIELQFAGQFNFSFNFNAAIAIYALVVAPRLMEVEYKN